MKPAAAASASPHISVLKDAVLAALAPQAGEVFVDATFGAGGYSRALLDAADCRVVGIDRDPAALSIAAEMEAAYGGRLKVLKGCFSGMAELVPAAGYEKVDGVALDLGVSSMQLDDPARGFSFRADGPLDMRMGGEGETAADLVNMLPEAELADLIWRYGDEHASRRIAREIVIAREKAPVTRTEELANLVARALGARGHRGKAGRHPATRTFQALRIRINDELGELERGLAAAEAILKPGGRLAVVSFHSLEDRIVKDFLMTRSRTQPAGSRHRPPAGGHARPPSFHLPKKSSIKPTDAECAANPRARSARLRVGVRTPAAPWGNVSGGAAS